MRSHRDPLRGQQAQVCDGANRWTVVEDCDQVAAQSGGSWSCCAIPSDAGVAPDGGPGPDHVCVPSGQCAWGCLVTTPGQAPTAADVQGLWAYMTQHYGSSVINKSSSVDMKIVSTLARPARHRRPGELPHQLHHHHRHAHLHPVRGWECLLAAGTSGRRSSCVPTSTSTWYRRRRWAIATYGARYLAAPRPARTTRPRRTGACSSSTGGTPEPCPTLRRSRSCSSGYGVSETDIEVVQATLREAAETVELGGICNAATAVALAWLNAHAPHLRAS